MEAESQIGELLSRVDEASSTSALAGIEGGVSGTSFAEVLGEYASQGGKGETSVRRQFAYGGLERGLMAEDINLNLKNQLASLKAQQTSGAQLGIGLATSAMGSHMMGIQSGLTPEGTSFLKNPFGLGLGGGSGVADSYLYI